MLTLLKNVECYSPKYLGKKDIIIACDKIYKIESPRKYSCELIENEIDCTGMFAYPGIIDQHVHIIGGGGEEGFTSRIAELSFNDIINAGVSTLVGVLGVDSFTRSLENLLAKARALDEQGITTYIYTGSYAVPTVTLTDSITNDIILIDKIIGTGEIAISDHRSSVPSAKELIKLSSDSHLGGLLSKKAGIVHIHVGEGKELLQPLIDILNNSDLPIEQFIPTHVNRTKELFDNAIDYTVNRGGYIDLTAGEAIGVNVPDAIQTLIDKNVDITKVTASSDANGSIPNMGVGKIQTLFDDIKKCVLEKNISPETAFSLVTINVANVLKLYPKKGVLQQGSDADIIIMDKAYNIKKMFCLGKLMIDN